MNKYRPRTNTPLLTRSFASASRQQLRKLNRENITLRFAQRFAGTGRSGGLQWTEGMCPRRRRRAIMRDVTQNFKEALHVPKG